MKLKASVKKETPNYQQYYGEIERKTMEMKEAEKIPCPAYLEIIDEKGWKEPTYLMIYYDKEGQFLTDLWFETLKEAKEQSRLEFGLSEDDWEVIEE
jgi:hypothetical protein